MYIYIFWLSIPIISPIHLPGFYFVKDVSTTSTCSQFSNAVLGCRGVGGGGGVGGGAGSDTRIPVVHWLQLVLAVLVYPAVPVSTRKQDYSMFTY